MAVYGIMIGFVLLKDLSFHSSARAPKWERYRVAVRQAIEEPRARLLDASRQFAERKQTKEAVSVARSALELSLRAAGLDRHPAQWDYDVATCQVALGSALLAHQSPAEALPVFRAAETVFERVPFFRSASPYERDQLSVAIVIGATLVQLGRFDEALATLRTSAARAEERLHGIAGLAFLGTGFPFLATQLNPTRLPGTIGSSRAFWTEQVCVVRSALGDALAAAGRSTEALSEYGKALATAEGLSEEPEGGGRKASLIDAVQAHIDHLRRPAGQTEQAPAG
jgi:tetratricopeptide (TPR) repeat protein